ncbi:MAG: flavodoxin family protein [Candidatus Pelethousia sp.]|nr:flavodoxin family protein [Candidatus Pelethousia sp.]
MTLLIVNTLPTGDEAARAAIEELTAAAQDYKVINTEGLRISPCVGCNACWLVTPGLCAIKDDYEEIVKSYLQYDAVVYLAGTALGFVNHRMKNVIDRILPLATMLTCIVNGQMRHVMRYEMHFKCGLLYAGSADKPYLDRWLGRVALNMGGLSLGAYPIESAKEVLACIS